MYTISKEFQFSASHVLHNLPGNHPCSRLHGHNYKVIFKFESIKLNNVGFVIDYRELDLIKKIIDENYDHRHLNDMILDINPTAENLAKHFFKLMRIHFSQLCEVTVQETDKTLARYTPLNDEED
jgi:6-pyruvoyltetrahydropterin/6-carboxytetrahydropterin synthase